jgi:hypothetical protein
MKSKFYQKLMPAFRNLSTVGLMLLGLVCLITACNKMDYTYKKFLKGGDIIYPGKADSILVFPGHNRIKLSWLLTSDPSIVLSRVYWNNKADSVSVPVDRSKGIDTISVTIDSLDEGYYNFQIYTYDKDGHTSVEADTTGQVFGKVYAGSLHNRVIKKSYWDQDTAYIFWYKAPQNAIGSKLSYQDQNGLSHTLTIAAEDTSTRLPDFKLHEGFQYQTGYLPDSMAIDTFYAANANITVNDTLKVLLPPYPSPDGTYAIINKLSGKVLTVDGASTSNNGNISQADFTGTANQLWKFVPSTEEDGYYAIENVNSGLGIAVAKASGDDGANILQYKYNSGSNDQWKPERVSGQYYKLMVLKNDKVIEIASGSDNAQQNTWNGGDNQQFELAWNMALNQSMKDASSGGSHPASDMLDGDNSTYWQPNSSDRKDDSKVWAIIDLGAPRIFDEFDQYWTHGHSHIDTYTIYYSNDGTTWKTAYQSPKGPDAGNNIATFAPVKGQYVKYEIHFESDGNVNMAELGVYYFPR